jgi:hypothetical protein
MCAHRPAGTLLQVIGADKKPIFADMLTAAFEVDAALIPNTASNVVRMSGKVAMSRGDVLTWSGCSGLPILSVNMVNQATASLSSTVQVSGFTWLDFRSASICHVHKMTTIKSIDFSRHRTPSTSEPTNWCTVGYCIKPYE